MNQFTDQYYTELGKVVVRFSQFEWLLKWHLSRVEKGYCLHGDEFDRLYGPEYVGDVFTATQKRVAAQIELLKSQTLGYAPDTRLNDQQGRPLPIIRSEIIRGALA